MQSRLDAWIGEIINERLKPLIELSSAEDLSGMARGIAFRLKEGLGILERQAVADDIRALDQAARGQLRKYGVRFGAFNIYLPLLLKPAAGELRLVLWALKHAGEHNLTLDTLPEPPKAGRTSIPADPALPGAFYRATGYHLCGQRAVRTDILERLADQIRPLIAWKPGSGGGTRPKGATGDGGFVVVPEMLSILGCSAEELGGVLRTLGFHVDRRPAPKSMIDPAPITPVEQTETTPAADAETVAGEESAAASEELATDAIEPASAPAEAEAEAAAVEPSEAAPATSEPAVLAEAEATVAVAEASDSVEPANAETAPEASAPESAEAVSASEPAGEAAATPAEEVLIEIWRPRRRHRGENRAVDGRQERQGERHRRHGRDGRDGRRDGGNRQPNRPGAPAAPAAAQAGGETAPADAAQQTGERRDGGRRDRNQRGGPPRNRDGERREGRPDQAARGARGDRDRRHGGGKGHGGEGRREDRRPQREDRPQGYMRSAAPPKRTTVDPDSPFAALSALKQQLEKRGNETGSS